MSAIKVPPTLIKIKYILNESIVTYPVTTSTHPSLKANKKAPQKSNK